MAIVGAVPVTSVTVASSAMSAVRPSPTIATISGSPAATTDPSAITRITSAMTMPITSAVPHGAVMFSAT